MMDNLKPCPFCGQKPRIKHDVNSEGKPFYQVRHDCVNFLSTMETFCYKTESDAVAAWNRRAKPENARQRALQAGICPMCEDCPDGCPIETPKDSRNIVTNADRIRSMSDEELHKFLLDFEAGDIDYAKTFCDLCCKDAALERKSIDCEGCLLWWLKNVATLPQGIDWLKQPAKEE